MYLWSVTVLINGVISWAMLQDDVSNDHPSSALCQQPWCTSIFVDTKILFELFFLKFYFT